LRPFFQLEELTASLRLVATLPRPGAGWDGSINN
jgi:predicted component of type VI protein secretion system